MKIVCQSCGMPLTKPEDHGSEASGEKSTMYCHFCFAQGKFTSPNMTLQEMIARVVKFAPKMGLSKEAAKSMAETVIPTLKRWSK